jgi:hypothetical protein
MTNIYLNPAEVRERVKAKGTKFATVVFQKKDGTTRTKNGLFKPHSKIKGTGRPTPKGYIAIYSPNEQKWGMFRDDAVVEIR